MAQQKKPVSPPSRVGVISELARNARLAWHVFGDKRVSVLVKAIIPATLLYLLSPIDIVPDALLGLGQLDDLTVLVLGVKLFLDLAPAAVVKEHLANIVAVEPDRWRMEEQPGAAKQEDEVIEGAYRQKGDPTKSGKK